jgi:hypothetical protein
VAGYEYKSALYTSMRGDVSKWIKVRLHCYIVLIRFNLVYCIGHRYSSLEYISVECSQICSHFVTI